MDIAIIGAGFTGLTTALNLLKNGHRVTVYESTARPGGLALGFKKKEWTWHLEQHYHHIFTSDTHIRAYANEVGVPFTFYRPNTSSLVDGLIYQIDSPLKLLQFARIPFHERVRMGMVLGYLKYLAQWQTLEQYTAHEWLTKALGKSAYTILWEPLLISKFGQEYKKISLAWFWARIKARSTRLGYPEGGFQQIADNMADIINSHQNGTIRFQAQIEQISLQDKTYVVSEKSGNKKYEMVVMTTPNSVVKQLVPQLPATYTTKLMGFSSIGAINMVLELKKPFLPQHIYWLNICDRSYPFLAVVEHTNFIDSGYYNNKHIVYIGNYLDPQHEYFSRSDDELFEIYRPFLNRMNPEIEASMTDRWVFRTSHAQPLVYTNYSQRILPSRTPLKGLYLANMQQVYPWDRGTNFAVEMGESVAHDILKDIA